MIESFSRTIMKYGFIRKCCRLLYHTLVQELRIHSLVFVALFWNTFFVTQCKKSIEFWNNRCILGYVWIASIVRVMREWFPYNRLPIFTIALIVRIELEAIQAIVIVPIVRVVSVVSVVFPYDRPDRLVLFLDDWDDRDDHMETRLYAR